MKTKSFAERIEHSPALMAIRQGLVMTTPLLMIGSFALVLKFMPLEFYQSFIASFGGGFLIDIFTRINQVTFGILGISVSISISLCYARLKTNSTGTILGAVLTALSVEMIFNGMFAEGFSMSYLGAQGMFTAIFSSVGASWLFFRLQRGDRSAVRLYTVGADADFNNIISVISPATIVVILACIFNTAIVQVFDVSGFEALFHKSMGVLFGLVTSQLARTLLFVLLTNVLWFFGIHGTNVLDSVAKSIFYDAGGSLITGMWSKPFMDTFVFMGGCGTTISLLLAILIFGKQKNTRGLAKMATLPMVFNMNELMVYGLPVVLNISFFAPFILVPILCTFTSAAAIALGLVPAPVASPEWVTPVVLGGYVATGSVAGSLLQIFNIALGVLVYRFFLVRYEARTAARMTSDLDCLCDLLRQSEKDRTNIALLELRGNMGGIARMMAADLRHVLKDPQSLQLFYQPQYNSAGRCIGAEALLRWNHPRCGYIYPPLLIAIARETGQLAALERVVFRLAARDIQELQQKNICPGKVSVNVTAASLRDISFTEFLQDLLTENPFLCGCLCVELTEEMSFMMGEAELPMTALRDRGIIFAVDDFSMGHTSVKYLQTNLFELVKLDGSLTRDIIHNRRSREIVASIVHMSETMGFEVLAEFVETAEQRDLLVELGCHLYQGWLYAPALTMDELTDRLKAEQRSRKSS